jgi:hypothetical protein
MADPQTSDPELESSSSDEEIDLDNVEITENPIALSSTQKDSVPEYPASPQATPPTSPVTAVEPAELTRTPSKLSDPPPIKRKVGRPRGANYKPRSKPTEKIISETDDTIVVLKSRHKPVQKKRIVVYKEDLFGDFDTPIEVVAKSRKKGRPPSLPRSSSLRLNLSKGNVSQDVHFVSQRRGKSTSAWSRVKGLRPSSQLLANW